MSESDEQQHKQAAAGITNELQPDVAQLSLGESSPGTAIEAT